jgi:hypothetical protein
MLDMETGSTELQRPADDIDWRHVWLTNVMIDSGKFGPQKIARHQVQTRKNSLSRRLRSLHLMRAALGPPR